MPSSVMILLRGSPDVVQHVPVDVAARAIDAARDAEVGVLVSIGGGSATGLAKAVARDTGLPILAVPTTYAGSEMTPIWGQTDHGEKTTGRDPASAATPRRLRPCPDDLDAGRSHRREWHECAGARTGIAVRARRHPTVVGGSGGSHPSTGGWPATTLSPGRMILRPGPQRYAVPGLPGGHWAAPRWACSTSSRMYSPANISSRTPAYTVRLLPHVAGIQCAGRSCPVRRAVRALGFGRTRRGWSGIVRTGHSATRTDLVGRARVWTMTPSQRSAKIIGATPVSNPRDLHRGAGRCPAGAGVPGYQTNA